VASGCFLRCTMRILRILTLSGPNIWSRHPVLEVWVDLEELKDSPSDSIPGFNDRLMGWLPSMIEHRCSIGERGGFFIRLRRGTYMAHILEHVTLELQTLAGTPVGFGKARESHDEGIYKVCIRYHEEAVAKACLQSAFDLLMAAVYDRPFDIDAEVRRLHELADRACLGPSTMAVLDAAARRNIPFRRLNRGSLVQLGHGIKQRRIWTAETDRTSAIAESIAQDKDLTKSMLRSAGIPVPEGRQVYSADDAWSAAQDLECAVVVKPLDANHGRGVFMDLSEEPQIRAAYEAALKEGSGVLVERFAKGSEHRLLVVGGRLLAAARGDVCAVVGDGENSAGELIQLQINSDPRRGDDETHPLNTILLDDPVVLLELQRQGFTLSSIVPAGVRAIVRRNDNLSMDVTEQVHPETAEFAVLAARVVGLDIAGIDLVVEDISEPLEPQGGAFVEVNAGPGLLMHLKPSVGEPRPVGDAILGLLYGDGDDGRIPITCVTGTNGKTTTCRILASILKSAGRHVGLTTSDGIAIDGRLIDTGDCAGPRSARSVLLNPLVDAAVFEAGRGGILREGLGFDRCHVAVVTNIATADHLGKAWITTPDEMYTVKRTPVDVVLPNGAAVLNAADPLVAEMADLSAGDVIFFARDRQHPVLSRHLEERRRAVTVVDSEVTLLEGDAATPIMRVDEIPCTHGGRCGFNVENALAATAAAWALKITPASIAHGLRTFQGNLVDDPGRFNVLEIAGKTLMLVDCRNEAALHAIGETLALFPKQFRSVVYSAEPDRRDMDIRAQGHLLGTLFDAVTLCEIETGPWRPTGQVIELLRDGLAEAPRTRRVDDVPLWDEAVDHAWQQLQPGQLLVVQTSSIAHSVRKIQSLLGFEQASPTPAASPEG
jgi:cyanophycin synthetase